MWRGAAESRPELHSSAALSKTALGFRCIHKASLAPGFGTVDLDGAGGNPVVTFEQVRFYSPTT